MTRGKKLLILLGVLVVIVAVAVLIVKISPQDEDTEDEEILTVIYSVDSDDISELAWTYNAQTITFVKDGDSWSYAADEEFPLDTTYIDTMLDVISEVSASKTISEVEDLNDYGLEEPGLVVKVTASDAEATLNFGNTSSLSGEYYTNNGDGNVYLVETTVPEAFHYNLLDIVKKESIPSMSDVQSFEIKNESDDMTIEYKENSGLSYSDDYVWFLKNGKSYTALDTENTENLLAVIQDLSLGDCVEYNVAESALENYGLADPDAIVTVNYSETVTVDTNETDEDGNTITEEQTDDEIFGLELGKSSDGTCYARLADSNMVYEIDETTYDSLVYTTVEELKPDEVISIEWNDVTEVDITLDGTTYTFKKEEKIVEAETSTEEETESENSTSTEETETETETEIIWTLNGEEVELENVLSAISNLTSTGYTGGVEPTKEADITIVAHRESGNFKDVTLAFHAYDSNSSITVLNGESTVYVARADIVSLIEKVNSLVL